MIPRGQNDIANNRPESSTFLHLVVGSLGLVGVSYYAFKSYDYFNKVKRYNDAKSILQDHETNKKDIRTADSHLSSLSNHHKDSRPVLLSGVCESLAYFQRKKLNAKSVEHKGRDLYVKTTELSHGFNLDTHYETSKFLMGDESKKLVVYPDDESLTPVLNAKKFSVSVDGSHDNYLYLPLYLLGLTSVTSYNIEYLSSNEIVNV